MADKQTADAVTAFVEMVFEELNAANPDVIDYFDAEALHLFWVVSDTEEVREDEARQFIVSAEAKVDLYGIDVVRIHGGGVFSVRISYVGLGFPAQLSTVRWYLEADGASDFQVAQIDVEKAIPPDGTSVAEVELVITDRGMRFRGDADDGLETADAVRFVVENQTDMRITVVLFNDSHEQYVGELPVSADKTTSYTFLLDFGEHSLETYAYEAGAQEAAPLGSRWKERFTRIGGDRMLP